jgi:hypothetical protein
MLHNISYSFSTSHAQALQAVVETSWSRTLVSGIANTQAPGCILLRTRYIPLSQTTGCQSWYHHVTSWIRTYSNHSLGSWFVLEPWITPSVFWRAASPAQSDQDIAKGQNAKANLSEHWNTWITEEDWQWLSERGVNSVRIPVCVRFRLLSSTLWSQSHPDWVLPSRRSRPFAPRRHRFSRVSRRIRRCLVKDHAGYCHCIQVSYWRPHWCVYILS